MTVRRSTSVRPFAPRTPFQLENQSVASEVHRYKVGDIGVTVLSDGFRMSSPDGYIINAGQG